MSIKPFGAGIKCPGYSAKDLRFNGHPLLCMVLVNLQHQSVEVYSAPATAETWILKDRTIKIDTP